MSQNEKYKLLVQKLQEEIVSSGVNLFSLVSNDSSVTYLDVYVLYRRLLTDLIAKQLNLYEYDSTLQYSELHFSSVPELDMDFYQLFSSESLRYFYLRNDVYLERLTKEELAFFVQKIKSKNFACDANTQQVIISTLPKVIFEYPDKKNYMSFYGLNTSPYMAPNQAIVIGFRYDAYNRDSMGNEQWNDIHNKQDIYLYEYLKKMQKELENKNIFPIQVIRYNEFSIGNVKI